MYYETVLNERKRFAKRWKQRGGSKGIKILLIMDLRELGPQTFADWGPRGIIKL